MSQLRTDVKTMLDQAWTEPGFCVPNPDTYPFQWLWDSCFHALIWAELGDGRGVRELETVLSTQVASGFVPHVNYWGNPGFHQEFWGQPGASVLTQPPMYGHAAAELVRRGFDVSEDVFDRCRRGLGYLLQQRLRVEGAMIAVLHPWETGCDDSARWDDWNTDGSWFETKGRLVRALDVTEGAARSSSAFAVGSVSFNALVAFNVAELASVGQAGDLAELGTELAGHVARRWSSDSGTWVDALPSSSGISGSGSSGSGSVRTADAMLALLVDDSAAGFETLEQDYLTEFGIRGTHRDEPSYEPDGYWRGSSWPQVTYLLGLAARRSGRNDLADSIGSSLATGAAASGLSEYWNPDTGTGQGARPQSWTGLALVRP